jgi:hypothetical protein
MGYISHNLLVNQTNSTAGINLISITISDVHPDPLGPDRERNENVKLNQEWIEIKNIGDEDFKLKGRVLIDITPTNQKRHKKVFFPKNPNFALPVDVKLRIYTGKMADLNDPATAPAGIWKYFLVYKAYIWNNTGDTAEIYASEADFNSGEAPLAQRSF